MRRQVLGAYVLLMSSIVLSALGSAELQAAGYWNVPSNLGQRTGHGFGGGYHAPWVLGPVEHGYCTCGKPTRLPCAPTPYYGCSSCDDTGRFIEAPSALDGVVPTAPASWAQPTMAAPVESRAAEPAPEVVTEPMLPEPEPIVVPAIQPTVEPRVEPTAESTVEPSVPPAKPLFSPPVQR